MADPFGSNISEKDAKRAEMADYNLSKTKLAQRVRQLRTDVDGIDENAASTAQVLAALAAADAAASINRQDITNAKDIISHASENLVVKSANEVKIQTSHTDRIRILANGNIGFFAATPVAQQADCNAVDATGNLSADEAASINAIRSCLRNLGLMA